MEKQNQKKGREEKKGDEKGRESKRGKEKGREKRNLKRVAFLIVPLQTGVEKQNQTMNHGESVLEFNRKYERLFSVLKVIQGKRFKESLVFVVLPLS